MHWHTVSTNNNKTPETLYEQANNFLKHPQTLNDDDKTIHSRKKGVIILNIFLLKAHETKRYKEKEKQIIYWNETYTVYLFVRQ